MKKKKVPAIARFRIHSNVHDVTEFYAYGYKLAAETLTKSFLKRGALAKRNFLIYPTLFTWRHYFELRLKALIVSLSKFQEKSVNRKIWGTHNLQALWTQRNSLYLSAGLPTGREIAANDKLIANVISLFTQIDSKSEAFRYAHDKDEKPSITDALEGIDLRTTIKAFRKAATLMEGESEMIAVYQQYEAEEL